MTEHSEEIKGEYQDNPDIITNDKEIKYLNTENNNDSLVIIEKKIDVLNKVYTKAIERSINVLELFSNRLDQLENRLSTIESIKVESSKEEKEKDKSKDKVKDKDKDKEKSKDKEKDKEKSKVKKDKEYEETAARKVYVAYKINCLSEINAILSTFKIDVKIFYTWYDPALIGRKKISESEYINDSSLFHPEIIVTNGHDLEEKSKTVKIADSKTGEFKLTVHYVGTLYMTSMDLKLFPFDCQNLQIQLKPYKMPLEDVVLEPKPASECCLEHHVTHEWTLSEHCMKVYETDALSSSVGKRYSTLYITVLTQRRPNWFIANIFMPSLFLSLVSLLAYTIDSNQVGERNEIVLATLMALIANKNIVSGHMPNVDYHTMVDIYLDCCFLLQFFILQVFMFLMLHLWIFLTLSEHREHVEQWINKAQTMQDSYDVSKLPLSHASSEDYKSTSSQSISLCSENRLVNSLSCGPPSPKKSAKSVTMSLDPTYFSSSNDFSSVEISPRIVNVSSFDGKLQSPTGSTPKSRFIRPKLTKRDSFTVIEDALTKDLIVKLRKWFPSMIIKDDTHFTNYGASTLVPVTSRDVVNILEEKAYIKKKKTLKQQITSTVNEQAGLRMKTIFAGNRLKAIRATANTKEDHDALRNSAALVLQTLWRTKRTKQRYLKHKAEMNANILESYARKIQRLFRQRKNIQLRRRISSISVSP
eukprot:gene18839-24624_t